MSLVNSHIQILRTTCNLSPFWSLERGSTTTITLRQLQPNLRSIPTRSILAGGSFRHLCDVISQWYALMHRCSNRHQRRFRSPDFQTPMEYFGVNTVSYTHLTLPTIYSV